MWALRGATTVPTNSREAILSAAEELTRRLLWANHIEPLQVVAGFFTLSPDLDAAYPAEGARRAGLQEVPLLCAQEVNVPGSLERCLRALLLVDGSAPVPEGGPVHVYLGGAVQLRPDWASRGGDAPGVSPRPNVLQIAPYVPGKPIEEVERELGLTDVVKLASNENPLGPSPRALAAIRAAAPRVHLYPDGNAFRLRQALAAHLDRQLTALLAGEEGLPEGGGDDASKARAVPAGSSIRPEQILVGNGSDEIIKMLAETFVRPGERVVFPTPTFSEYEFACRVADGEPVPVPAGDDLRFDMDALAEAASHPGTRLVFVANPNNPTGALVGREELARLMDSLRPETVLVLDEAYYEFVDDPAYTPALAWVAAGRPVFVLRTFSKIYGLAGLRLGYAVGPAPLVAMVQRVREPFNVNSLAQEAAIAALADTEHVKSSRELVRQGRAELTRELTGRGLRVVPSQANFVYVDLGRDSRPVFHALLQKGVIVRTGDIFGNPTFIRVTVGLPEQNRRFLAALDEVLSGGGVEQDRPTGSRSPR